jgi:hypothetical protein
MEENCEIPDEVLQYMHDNPVFNIEQEKRYHTITQVIQVMKLFSSHFENYLLIGEKLCSEFTEINECLSQIDTITKDSSYSLVNDLFRVINSSFKEHFSIVKEYVFDEVQSFINKHFNQLTKFEDEYRKSLDAYRLAEEKYVKEPSKQQNVEQTLIEAHSLSTFYFYDYSKKMESIELQFQALLPKVLLSYIKSVKGPFETFMSKENDIKGALEESQKRANEYEGRLKEFTASTARLKQSISAQLPVYWGRVRADFTGTKSKSIQGFLWKKCGRFPVRWERRFFMVSDCFLTYSDNVENIFDRPRTLSLLFSSVRPDPSATRPHCFTIQTKERSYTFQALTEWEMKRWLAVIQNNVLSTLNYNGFDEDEPLEEETSNYVCADCGNVGAPWCSVNHGVYLCDLCCGVHRSLPSTCSRIRSLKLDSIDTYQRMVIDAIGSDKSNTMLEEKCGDEKITPRCDIETREKFIKKKYLEKAFVSDDVVDIYAAIQNEDIMSVYKYIIQGNLQKQQEPFTVLHAAAIVGNPIIFQLIVLNTTLIDVVDENGLTPMSYAAAYGNIQIIDILLNFGSKPKAGNAYSIAKACSQEEAMKRLSDFKDETELESFDIPHKEIKPVPFDQKKFIDPNLGVQRKVINKEYAGDEKEKLRIAIGSVKVSRQASSVPHISLPPPDPV